MAPGLSSTSFNVRKVGTTGVGLVAEMRYSGLHASVRLLSIGFPH
jgi:hypothetical protein